MKLAAANTTVEIIKYTPAYRQDVLRIQEHHWGMGEAVNNAYFEWKYLRNPYMKEVLIYLAISGGEIVGMRGIYGTQWQMANTKNQFVWPCTGDLVIHPDFRNRGLLEKLNEAALKDLASLGFEYVFNFSAGEINLMQSLTTGWKSIGALPNLRCRKRHQSVNERIRSVIKKIPFIVPIYQYLRGKKEISSQAFSETRNAGEKSEIINPFLNLDCHLIKAGEKANGNIWASDQARPEQMSDLMKHQAASERFNPRKDREYFAWRYGNPFSNYRFIFFGKEKLEGYLVLQASKRKYQNIVNVLDWAACDSKTETKLFKTALAWGQFEAVDLWSGMLSKDTERALKKMGFSAPVPKRFTEASVPTVLVKVTRHELSEKNWLCQGKPLLMQENWNLTMVESDGY